MLGYLDHGNHAIMGYALAITLQNFLIEPDAASEQKQEQEIFFWNVKNHKISLFRINARIPVLYQLKVFFIHSKLQGEEPREK